MIRVYLIRHGATAGNLQRRYIGRTDEPLCDTGVRQVQALQAQDLHVDWLFVSPLLRARQTADILFPHMPLHLIENMRETDFGLFEGKTAAELADVPAYQAWVDSQCTGPIPNGEDVSHFKARCRAAFARAIADVKDDTCAAFVVHGGVVMAILEGYAQPQGCFYDYHVGNGGYIACEYSDGALRVLWRFEGGAVL